MPARIAHFEIQGPDDTGVAAFYRELLDWPIQSRGEGYSIVDRGRPGSAVRSPTPTSGASCSA